MSTTTTPTTRTNAADAVIAALAHHCEQVERYLAHGIDEDDTAARELHEEDVRALRDALAILTTPATADDEFERAQRRAARKVHGE